MKQLTVHDFPSMTDSESVKMRGSIMAYFNKHRDNKDNMAKFQNMLTTVLRKANECLQEHEVDPRTPSGKRIQQRLERDQAAAIEIPLNVPAQELVEVVIPAITQPQASIVGMAVTGAATQQQELVVPRIDIPNV